MGLKEARGIAAKWRELSKQIVIDIPAQAAIILDDRITELEGQFDIVQQCAKDNAIALGQQQEIVEKGAKILYARITELEAENEILLRQVIDRENWKAYAEETKAQRDELLKAAIGVLSRVQNTYHSDNRGPGDQCSILENAIEKTIGKKWWDAIEQPVVDG